MPYLCGLGRFANAYCQLKLGGIILMKKCMADAKECIERINAMSKTDFHQRILRGVAASEEFSCLVSIGIKYPTHSQKQHICQMLVQAGIPFEFSDDPDFDEKLTRIAFAITTSAVKVI